MKKKLLHRFLLVTLLASHLPGTAVFATETTTETTASSFVESTGTTEEAPLIDPLADWTTTSFEKYYTFLKDSETRLFFDLALREELKTEERQNQTFFAKELMTHEDGSQYLSLYSFEETHVGYVTYDPEKEEDTLSETPEGISQATKQRVLLIDPTAVAYKDFSLETSFSTTDLQEQAFLVEELFYHFNGKEYLVLNDLEGNFVGIVEKSATEELKQMQRIGAEETFENFVNLNGLSPIWESLDFKKKMDAADYMPQTFKTKNIYLDAKGTRYTDLYNNRDELIGYIDFLGFSIASGQQGIYQSYEKYVTVVTPGGYPIWKGFSWKTQAAGSFQGKTYLAKGVYNHFNGSRYLSLYDNKGAWIGYINENGTQLASGQHGIYQSYEKYVTVVTDGGYPVWRNFAWSSTVPGNFKGHTYLAKGVYHHFNGSRYLSLYDNQGKWVGYMNESGTRLAGGQQGIYQTHNKHITVTRNYPIWRNFSWTATTPGNFTGNLYSARGIYNHFNGSKYLSLYDENNKWIGYINEDAVTYTSTHLFVMGHGAYDPGSMGNGTNEREFTRNELLPHLRKYASQLKNNTVIFYDPARNLYQDGSNGKGLYEPYYAGYSSITEIHLDSGPPTATGGHVIVHPNKSSYLEDLAIAGVIQKYNSLWGAVSLNRGLSYRQDLLNLNVSQNIGVSYRLAELGFISNKKDLALLRANRDKIAKELIEAATGEKL